eukprot:5454655-Prymnesium_polylepis.2
MTALPGMVPKLVAALMGNPSDGESEIEHCAVALAIITAKNTARIASISRGRSLTVSFTAR